MTIDTPARPRVRETSGTPEAPARQSSHDPIELPRMPGRRSPKWIALGILAICLGGLLSYAIYARLATETAVLVAVRTVYRGEPIERGDLAPVMVSGGSLDEAVPAGELDRLIGRRASLDLAHGSVVARSAVVGDDLPVEGRAVVGLRLAAGRAPSSLLVPGAPVRLVAMPAADTVGEDKLAGGIFSGRVLDQTDGADGVSILLNVDVAESAAPTIALLGAQDRIAVVRDSER